MNKELNGSTSDLNYMQARHANHTNVLLLSIKKIRSRRTRLAFRFAQARTSLVGKKNSCPRLYCLRLLFERCLTRLHGDAAWSLLNGSQLKLTKGR